jgi:hypothetical protein
MTPPPILLAFDRQTHLHSLTGTAPIRFQVNGQDLLGITLDTPNPALPLSLLAFACYGMLALRVAQQCGRAALQLDDWGGDLLFVIQEQDVIIHVTGWNRKAQARFGDLVQIWNNFGHDVQQYILTHFPAMNEAELWQMLDREPTEQERLSMSAAWWFEQEDTSPDESTASPTT